MLAALRLAGELQDLLISRRERRKEGRLLKKIIKKEQPTDEDIERILHDICEAVHSSCDSSCPIYKDVLTDKQRNNHHCSYFKNGKAMLEALKMVYSPERFPIFGSSEEIDVLDRENTGKHLDRRRRRKER